MLRNQETYTAADLEREGYEVVNQRTGRTYSFASMRKQRRFVRLFDGVPYIVRGRDGDEIVSGPVAFRRVI